MQINGFELKTQPWEHQLKALQYLYPRNAAALYTKPGSGKTKIMIDLVVNRGFKRVLVVAPKKPCSVWKYQISIHSNIDLNNVIELYKLDWRGKQAELKLVMNQDKEDTVIFICNYDSVWRKPLDRMLFYKRLGIDCVICDESHRIKSPSSKCSRFLSLLGRSVQHRYLLTGTPLAENPMDVYAQYRFLDPSIFGTNYAEFCNEYQNLDPLLSSRVGFPILDKNQPYKNLDLLRQKMFSCAFYMKATVTLPKTTRKIVRIPMDSNTECLYKELAKEGAIDTEDGFLIVDNILAMTIRKQQLTSGYMSLEQDDGSVALKKVSNYRRNYLCKFLKSLPEEPIVVFAKFRKDLEAIKQVAEKLNCGYSEVSGSEDTLSDWTSGKTRILGVQYTAGSESIDLTRSSICIFYTLDHSLGKYDQARKRIHRPGQTRACTYYHFVATMSKGRTVDEEIIECWKNKEDYISKVMQAKV